jgi:polyisoprenoid-binding protein YceI
MRCAGEEAQRGGVSNQAPEPDEEVLMSASSAQPSIPEGPGTWPDALIDIGPIELCAGHWGIVGLIPYDGHVVLAVIDTPSRPAAQALSETPSAADPAGQCAWHAKMAHPICMKRRSSMSDEHLLINAHAGDDLAPLAGSWEVDPTHSALEFVARYAVFTLVRGRFMSFSGTVVLDPLRLEAIQIDVDIDASSVDTAMPARDAHLRSEDFFDVERHPKISFRSQGATVLAAGRYTVHGELTIRGIAQPVRLDVDAFGCAPDVLGNSRLGLSATARVRRSVWGITWNAPVPGGGVTLAEEVDLELAVSLVPAGTAARSS